MMVSYHYVYFMITNRCGNIKDQYKWNAQEEYRQLAFYFHLILNKYFPCNWSMRKLDGSLDDSIFVELCLDALW